MLIRPIFAWLAGAAGLALVLGGILTSPIGEPPISEASTVDWGAEAAETPIDFVRAIALGPDGRRVAWIEARSDGASLWLDEGNGQRRRLLRNTEATEIVWSKSGDWLFLPSGHSLVLMTTSNQAGSGILTRLGGDTGRRFLATDAWQTAALVAEDRDQDGDGRDDSFALLRIRLGGEAEPLWTGSNRIADVAAGPDGTVWMRLVGRDLVTVARLDAHGPQAVYRCRPLERCDIVSVDQQGTPYLMTSAGGDLDALHRLAADGTTTLVASDPLAIGDGENAALDAVSNVPVAFSVPYAGGRMVGASPAGRNLVAAIARRFPRASEVRFVTRAQSRWLVGVRDGQHAEAAWYLADDRGARWIPLARRHNRTDQNLPLRRFESFQAQDGARVFAYVTRPAAAPRPRPLVVLVHGGPWSTSPPGYNATAARLAQNGYLVVEPQFRGSRGYGRRYLTATGDDFGDGTALHDIRDSADWLVSRGEADPARIAVMGASFGGYAALLATTLWPERFQGAIAAVPPPDLAWTSRYQAQRIDGDAASLSLKTSLAHLGLDIDDANSMARLTRESPMGVASRLKRPVLILAGEHDEQVPIRSVNTYAAKLCGLGKQVEYWVAKDQGHRLDGDNTTRAVQRLTDDFLSTLFNKGQDRPVVPTRMSGLVERTCAGRGHGAR